MHIYYIKEINIGKIQVDFPKSRGFKRVDDRRVISDIIYVLNNGLRWCDTPKEYGPHKTLYNRFVGWRKKEYFKISPNFYLKWKILPNSCK